MHFGKLLCLLGLSAIATLGDGLTAKPAASSPLIASKDPSTQPPPSLLKNRLPSIDCPSNRFEGIVAEDLAKFQSRRVELFYYRNAANVVNLLNEFLCR